MASPDPPIPHAQSILERAHTPDTAATHYNERIVKRPLYLRPSSPTPSARALRRRALTDKKQAAQKRAKLRPRPLSAARKRALGIHQIPKEQQKYAIYEPLHNLWIGYMRDVLGISNAENGRAYVAAGSSGQLLASADMHGALLTVIRSRCVSRVGVTGIVVQDTKFTFDLITKQNVIKSIPKERTTFRFEISLPTKPQDTTTNTAETPDEKKTTITTTKTSQTEPSPPPKPLIFDINGTSFQSRAPDRANKKFRIHYQPDI